MRLPNGWRVEEGTGSPNGFPLFSEEFLDPYLHRATHAEPGMRPATSSTTVTAKKTRSGQKSSDGIERQAAGMRSTSKSSQRAGQKCGKRKQDQKKPPPRMQRRDVKNRLPIKNEEEKLAL